MKKRYKTNIMKESLTERIEKLMSDRGQTRNAFSSSVGIGASNFNRKMLGKQPFTKRDFSLIANATGVNREWLEFGIGDMGELQQPSTPTKAEPSQTSNGQPFYDVDFLLGFNEAYNDTTNVPSRYISVPGYEKADFWCRTSGDSMKPFISNGDVIALREIQDWQSFLPMNEIYAIMTTNDLRTVKVVRRGSDDMHYTLHAYNEEYEDQEISKASITKVYKVMGCLKSL